MYKLAFIFCVYILHYLVSIIALYVASVCNKSLPPSLFTYVLSVSAFVFCILYVFTAYTSVGFLHYNLKLVNENYRHTETASGPLL